MLKELGISSAIDCHTHSGGIDTYNYFSGNIPDSQAVNDLILKTDISGITKVITTPFPGTLYFNPKILVEEGRRVPSGLEEFPYQIENAALVKDCQQFKDKIFPFACIDPIEKPQKQMDSLQLMINDGIIFGLKLHTLASNCSAEDLIISGFADFAQDNDMPILIHSGVDSLSHPLNIVKVGEQYKQLRLAIAHLAALDSEVIKHISKMPNIFVDCSPFLQICNAVSKGYNSIIYPNAINPDMPCNSLYNYYQILKDNMIWGTDEPWTTSIEKDGTIRSNHSYFDEVKVIEDLFHVSEEAVLAITNRNTTNFLFG
jgi:hypothetical protein